MTMTNVVPTAVAMAVTDQSKSAPTSDSQSVEIDSCAITVDNFPRSQNDNDIGKDKDKDKEKDRDRDNENKSESKSEIAKGDDPDMPVHILSGNSLHTLPYSDGCSAPLTARPFALSRIYEHLVASPQEFRAVLTERLGRLQVTLPQLGSDQLRQAKADMVYLKSILEDEGPEVAQIKAGAVWSSTT